MVQSFDCLGFNRCGRFTGFIFAPHPGYGKLNPPLKTLNQLPVGGDEGLLGFELESKKPSHIR